MRRKEELREKLKKRAEEENGVRKENRDRKEVVTGGNGGCY